MPEEAERDSRSKPRSIVCVAASKLQQMHETGFTRWNQGKPGLGMPISRTCIRFDTASQTLVCSGELTVSFMLLLWRTPRRAPAPACHFRTKSRHVADCRPFREGDHVLLRPKNDRNGAFIFKQLKEGQSINTHHGTIPHASIIGKSVREIIETTKPKSGTRQSASYRLHEAKLEEYVRLTRRLVTPLYPQDARLIVELLDLHPEPPLWHGENEKPEPKLEILEAGTGHGALTLYLSRAIHAANRPLPRRSVEVDADDEFDHVAIDAWKATRNAIIHTIEVSPRYSAHAEKIVKAYRHGMYYHNIDFHVGNVSEWITSALTSRKHEAFLSHAFLDLPSTEDHLSVVAKALRTDGTLIVFCPSITQIMACVSKVKDDDLPLELENVLELPTNNGAGGREWDVRAVKPRAAQKAEAAARITSLDDTKGKQNVESDEDGAGNDSGVEVDRVEGGQSESVQDGAAFVTDLTANNKDEGWKMVCRPKVGGMIVGGGFLGVFKEQRA